MIVMVKEFVMMVIVYVIQDLKDRSVMKST